MANMVVAEIHILLLVVPCLLLTCSIILNITGIYYLLLLNQDFTNHKILLRNLSFIEILSSVAMIVYWFDGYFQFCSFRTVSAPNSMSLACIFGFAVDWYFYLLCLLSPMTLLPDRFLAVTYPFRYRDIFAKRRTTFIVFAQWIITLILVTQLVFLSHKHWLKYLQSTAIAIELLVFGSATVIYLWIVYKLRKQGDLSDRASAEFRVLKVAFLIILTFLCFVVIPEVTLFILTQLHFDMADTYQKTFYTVTCINYVCDPLIYIFGYPPLRQAVKLFRRNRRMNQVENVQNVSASLRQSTLQLQQVEDSSRQRKGNMKDNILKFSTTIGLHQILQAHRLLQFFQK